MQRRLFWLLIAIVFIAFLASCREERPAAIPAGYVGATEAYVKHFGNPPQGEKGRAYARVAYLPLKDDLERIRPIPIFLFDDKDQLTKILQRIVSDALILPHDSLLAKPFPGDLRVAAASVDAGTQTLTLQTAQSWDVAAQQAAGRAFAETALQFPGIERVRMTLNGETIAGMPQDGYRHEPDVITDVGPPRLVLMAGVWEGEGSGPEELLVEFNRPIKLNDFSLYEASGEKVEGDYYISIFQMAVVVHPREPGRYQEGHRLRAVWDVTDYLGRANRGESTLVLLRYEH